MMVFWFDHKNLLDLLVLMLVWLSRKKQSNKDLVQKKLTINCVIGYLVGKDIGGSQFHLFILTLKTSKIFHTLIIFYRQLIQILPTFYVVIHMTEKPVNRHCVHEKFENLLSILVFFQKYMMDYIQKLCVIHVFRLNFLKWKNMNQVVMEALRLLVFLTLFMFNLRPI